MLLALHTLKLLLPPSLSVANAFCASLETCVQLFPSAPFLGQFLLIATVLSVPLVSAALAAVFQLIASPKLLPAIYFALASQCGLLLAGPALVDETGDARVRTRRVAQGAAVRSVMYLSLIHI